MDHGGTRKGSGRPRKWALPGVQLFSVVPQPIAEKVREIAAQRGVTPSSLLAEWIIEAVKREEKP